MGLGNGMSAWFFSCGLCGHIRLSFQAGFFSTFILHRTGTILTWCGNQAIMEAPRRLWFLPRWSGCQTSFSITSKFCFHRACLLIIVPLLFFLYLYLSVHASARLFNLCLSVCLSVCLPVCQSFCRTVCPSVYLPARVCVCSIYLPVWPSVCLFVSVFLSDCLSVYLPAVCLFVLSVYLSARLTICLSVCLSLCLTPVCLLVYQSVGGLSQVCLSASFFFVHLFSTACQNPSRIKQIVMKH